MGNKINERIELLVQHFGNGKNTEFASIIGISEGNIRGYIKGVIPKQDILEKIARNCDINADWLLTGRGEMLKTQRTHSNKCIDVVSEDEANYSCKNQIKIPLVRENAIAGFGNAQFAIKEQDVKDYYIVPKFKYCHIDFMIEIHGTSMQPRFNSGDIVACTIIRESHFIQWNHIYIIATTEQGILCKRICKSTDPEAITAISDNPEFPPFDIPKQEITGIALIIGSIQLE